MKRLLVSCIFLLLIVLEAAGQSKTISIGEHLDRKLIDKDFYIYDEKNNAEESFENLRKEADKFKLSNTKVAAYFASSAGHWLKFQVTSTIDRQLIVDFGTLSYDELDFYIVPESGKMKQFPKLSWKINPKNRPMRSEFYAYSFFLEKNKKYDFYARGKNIKGTFRMPIYISSPDGFNQAMFDYERFFGIFFGVSIFIIAIGISFYVLSYDKSYLYYALSVVSLIIQSAGINGYLASFISDVFPAAADPNYANIMIPVFVFFQINFYRVLLLHPTSTPRWIHSYSKYLGYYCMGMALMMFSCLVYSRMYFYMSYMVYIMYTGMIINVVLNLWQGFTFNKSNAIITLISSSPFFLYLVFMILTNLRLVKQISPYNIVMWCMIFDNIIMCIGLAFRFGNMSKRQLHLQKEISEQQKQNFEIESERQKEKYERLKAELYLQKEKERISKDLHDNIGSQLTYISSNIDYFSNQVLDKSDLNLKLNELSDYARDTTQQLRNTVWAMSNEYASTIDFKDRIYTYVKKQVSVFEHLKLEFDGDIDEQTMPAMSALNLFRVVQESINNIMKHSQASLVKIKLRTKEESLSLEIADNGQGFELGKSVGNGLYNMESRIKDIQGKYKIKSSPASGTIINIEIPISKNTPISVLD